MALCTSCLRVELQAKLNISCQDFGCLPGIIMIRIFFGFCFFVFVFFFYKNDKIKPALLRD